jgi:hypothetical protein
MGGQVRFDELLEALADGYRRELLIALLEHNPQDDGEPDPLNIHDSPEDAVSQFDIFMYHLPMLEKLGIVEWNEATDEIVKGPDWEEFAPLLRLIEEHKDELPAEWFGETEPTVASGESETRN